MQSGRFRETSYLDVTLFGINSLLKTWIVRPLTSLLTNVQVVMISYLRAGKVCSHKNTLNCEEAILEIYNKKKLCWKRIKKNI